MTSRLFFTMEQLTVSFGTRHVVQNMSFSLEKNTLTGLLGANGCGKTTLLRAICGHLPHTGVCRLEGEVLEQLHTRQLARRISYIPQRSGISISLPVLEVVLMGYHPVLGLLQNPSAQQKKAALRALEETGLAGMQDRDYLTLSEGQKQLCILARTLVEDTGLLLLDEPDSALDFPHRYQILGNLKKLVRDGGRAGLLCLHDPTLAFAFCDQILLMKEGRCTASLHPGTDSLASMQEALAQIYGPVFLTGCRDPLGRERLVLLPADGEL